MRVARTDSGTSVIDSVGEPRHAPRQSPLLRSGNPGSKGKTKEQEAFHDTVLDSHGRRLGRSSTALPESRQEHEANRTPPHESRSFAESEITSPLPFRYSSPAHAAPAVRKPALPVRPAQPLTKNEGSKPSAAENPQLNSQCQGSALIPIPPTP
jgi:hypothetical protein